MIGYKSVSTLQERSALVLSILSLSTLLSATPDLPSKTAIESITVADLKSDLYFLASDEMRGRNISSLFNQITSRYLSHRFESMGLRPFSGESYFQYFSLVQGKLSEPNRMEIQHSPSPLSTVTTLGEQFFPSTLSANGRVSAPLVFVGYGITAHEHDYDDYGDLETKGKIVVIIDGEPGEKNSPSPFNGSISSEHNRELNKILNAQSHGAVAAIFVSDPTRRPSRNFSRRMRSVWPEHISRGRYNLKIWTNQIKIPVVHVSNQTAKTLLQGSSADLEQIKRRIDREAKPHSFPLPKVSTTLQTAITREETEVRNVMAYLPGSDPTLKNEVVIVSAHFDHVGSSNGDIFNGADDDGSGTVGLLEIAEAYALNPQKPKRSLLFVGWNAEENGLLGSRYYVEHPIVSLARTVAVFQMDMIGRNEEIPDPKNPRFRGLPRQKAEQNTNSVNILGYSRSDDLRSLVAQNNQYVGLDLHFRYDNNPSNLLRRSDNWPFLVKGVPALFFHTGLHPDYHRPTDTAEKINYQKMEKIVRLVFLSSWNASNEPTRPQLNSSREK